MEFTISAFLELVCSILGHLRSTEAGFQAIFSSFCDIAQFPVVFPMRIEQFTLFRGFIHRCGPRLLDDQVFSCNKKFKGTNESPLQKQRDISVRESVVGFMPAALTA